MRVIRVLSFIFFFTLPAGAGAAELVMFQSPLCEWCKIWDEEVGIIYDKTPEARRAPLRRVDIDDPRPEDLRPIRPVIYTPTFVLMEDGREAGRITGYPGEAFFWQLLEGMIAKLDTPVFGCLHPDKQETGKQAKLPGKTTNKVAVC